MTLLKSEAELAAREEVVFAERFAGEKELS
jgi:hypothetical protein